ncbi:penicillin-binding transpeptidase domain-containing protein [Paenibacillus phoenicis]|uniref:Penicillin-binding transpeptidase domain-containing protein n=2 Tax=Paenibacillus phoenicis TaxID=554117 RepID=A0ABU5PM13_9BACL|nr:penicillin-binding transpeptidase domain-containing protein [Paenibacillus phoenicis]MEA3570988.1 penicillin-binding transpeptidase domain-containing protein [Paenibacillus phoenicis]
MKMNKYVIEDPQEQQASIRRHFHIRLNLFFFSAFAMFTLIIIRLAILQFVEGPSISMEEVKMRFRDVPMPPVRGSILAAGGEKLAYSTPIQTLYLTLQKSNYDPTTEAGRANLAEAAALAKELKKVFDTYGDPNAQMSEEEILDAMDLKFRRSGGFAPRRIKSNLTEQETAYFLAQKSRFLGIDIIEESVRHYDPDLVAVQTVGYLKKFQSTYDLDWYKPIRERRDADPALQYTEEEFAGFDGLELYYQQELRGKNGYKRVPIDPRNMANGVAEIVPPVKGYDLHTTINKNVQQAAEQAILDQIEWVHHNPVSGSVHPHAKTGYAVAMEVDTGNVIVMASMPDYDTNVWQSGGVSEEVWSQISSNYRNGTITPFSSGRSGHNFDSTVYLGSTIKPLSVLIGLNEGLFTTKTKYSDRGIAYFGRNDSASVRNSSGHVYGSIYPKDAIRFSSNAFMVDMVGEKLYNKYRTQGIEVWDEYMKQFGLGVSTGIDLPGEYLGILDYKDERETALARLAYASFGQQGKYTTMQLAQYTATLANRGKRMQPRLVQKITDAEGRLVMQFEPKVLNEVKMKDAYWDEVIDGMRTDVSAFGGFPYDFARKTGTSQQAYKNKLLDNGVFIAFAPREKPKLAVAVVIPEGGFGAHSAAPVARKIFDAYDREYGLDGNPKK